MFLKTQEYFRKYTKHSTIPSAVAIPIAMFVMAPFSCNQFRNAWTCASSFSPNNYGLPHFLPGSFITSGFSSCGCFLASSWKYLTFHSCKAAPSSCLSGFWSITHITTASIHHYWHCACQSNYVDWNVTCADLHSKECFNISLECGTIT